MEGGRLEEASLRGEDRMVGDFRFHGIKGEENFDGGLTNILRLWRSHWLGRHQSVSWVEES